MTLESKFIEGTNNQYSIRNDGVIIKHWHVRANKKIFYEDRILVTCSKGKVQTTTFGKHKTFVIKTLLKKYFNSVSCKSDNCNNTVERRLQQYCNSCIAIRNHKCSLNNQSKGREVISKTYAANKLKIPISYLTQEMYEEYKALLLVKRLLVQKNNCSINSLR